MCSALRPGSASGSGMGTMCRLRCGCCSWRWVVGNEECRRCDSCECGRGERFIPQGRPAAWDAIEDTQGFAAAGCQRALNNRFSIFDSQFSIKPANGAGCYSPLFTIDCGVLGTSVESP